MTPSTGRSAAASPAAGSTGDGFDHFVGQRGPGQALAKLGYQVGAASRRGGRIAEGRQKGVGFRLARDFTARHKLGP
jgi:hypothetical protein